MSTKDSPYYQWALSEVYEHGDRTVDTLVKLRSRVTDLESADWYHETQIWAERALTAEARVTELEHRLAPAQGHGYDNEVERQRAVIEGLQDIATRLTNERNDWMQRALDAEINAIPFQEGDDSKDDSWLFRKDDS